MPLYPEEMYLKERVVALCKEIVDTDVDGREVNPGLLEEMDSVIRRITSLKMKKSLDKIMKKFGDAEQP